MRIRWAVLERDGKWMQSFGLKTKGVEHLEGIDERIILKWLAKKCGRVPWKAGNILTSRVYISFSRRTLLHGLSYISCNRMSLANI
jgi:hypothetical protein